MFVENLERYPNGKVKFNITWATKKIKLLFKIKDNVCLILNNNFIFFFAQVMLNLTFIKI